MRRTKKYRRGGVNTSAKADTKIQSSFRGKRVSSPKRVSPPKRVSSPITCPICFDTCDESNTTKLSCHEKHILCKECTKRIKSDKTPGKDKCPLCRKTVKELKYSDRTPENIARITAEINKLFKLSELGPLVNDANKEGLLEYFLEHPSLNSEIQNVITRIKRIWGMGYDREFTFIHDINLLKRTFNTKAGKLKTGPIGKATLDGIRYKFINAQAILAILLNYGIIYTNEQPFFENISKKFADKDLLPTREEIVTAVSRIISSPFF